MSEEQSPGSAPEVDAQIAEMAERMAMETASNALRERVWMEISATPEMKRKGSRFAFPIVRPLALGGVLAASVAVGIALWLLPGSPSHPAPAFAQVEHAMGTIRTVTWRQAALSSVVLYPNGTYEKRPGNGYSTMWARLDTPTLATEYKDGYRRVSLADESYQIGETEGLKNVRSYQRLRWGIPPSLISGSGKRQTPRERILNTILFSPEDAQNKKTWTESSPNAEPRTVERTPWESQETVLDGKKVIRFDASVRFKEKTSAGSFPWRNTEDLYSLWVEPDTHHVVRREVRVRYQTKKNTVEYVAVSDQFRYNQEPPAGLFEVLPPAGTRFFYVPLAPRTANADEQAAIEQLLRRAFNAWNQKDTATYAACWDFDYELRPVAENRRFAKREMEFMQSQKPFKEWRIRNINKAQTRIGGAFTRHTSEDPFPPKVSNEFLTVVTAQVAEPSGRTHTVPFTVNVRRDEDGFRLIRNFTDAARSFTTRKPEKPSDNPTGPADRR